MSVTIYHNYRVLPHYVARRSYIIKIDTLLLFKLSLNRDKNPLLVYEGITGGTETIIVDFEVAKMDRHV